MIAIPTILVLVIACFFLMHAAPGGPFTSERPLPAAVLANIEARYGLDQPLWKQLWDYIANIVFHFDFGPSFKHKDRDVNDIIAQVIPGHRLMPVSQLVYRVLLDVCIHLLAAASGRFCCGYSLQRLKRNHRCPR